MTIDDFEEAKVLQAQIEKLKRFDTIDKPDYTGIHIVCAEWKWAGGIPLSDLGISYAELKNFLNNERAKLEQNFNEILSR